MAALVEVRGMGHRIRGELYRVSEQGLDELDQLEGFVGKNMDDNIYIRKKITVLLDNARYEAFTYFIADPDTHLDAVRDGTAAMAREYAADMAIGELKPGWEDPHQPN